MFLGLMTLDPEAERRYALHIASLSDSLMTAIVPYSAARGFILRSQYDHDVKQASKLVYELLKAFQDYHRNKNPTLQYAVEDPVSILRLSQQWAKPPLVRGVDECPRCEASISA